MINSHQLEMSSLIQFLKLKLAQKSYIDLWSPSLFKKQEKNQYIPIEDNEFPNQNTDISLENNCLNTKIIKTISFSNLSENIDSNIDTEMTTPRSIISEEIKIGNASDFSKENENAFPTFDLLNPQKNKENSENKNSKKPEFISYVPHFTNTKRYNGSQNISRNTTYTQRNQNNFYRNTDNYQGKHKSFNKPNSNNFHKNPYYGKSYKYRPKYIPKEKEVKKTEKIKAGQTVAVFSIDNDKEKKKNLVNNLTN